MHQDLNSRLQLAIEIVRYQKLVVVCSGFFGIRRCCCLV